MQDVHALAPSVGPWRLGKVGLAGVRKPLVIHRADRDRTLAATFEVYVDLPGSRKGSDLSRNAEILAEIIDRTVERPATALEDACTAIARELLQRHGYANVAEVSASAEYFRARGVAPGRTSLEDYLLVGHAWAERSPHGVLVRQGVGAEAVGMTACPCAMETCREALVREHPQLSDPAWKDLPMISHNQRNRSRLTLVVAEGTPLEADDLLDVVEAAQSSPTYAILKRGDEGAVVLRAHRNPRFVEDVVRELLSRARDRFPQLPEDAEVWAETRSEESIHKYDVRAEHRATMGELRGEGPRSA